MSPPNDYRPDPIVPASLRRRPIHPTMRIPVPWFLADQDAIGLKTGSWNFREVMASRANLALRNRVCWICGTPHHGHATVIGGPASIITGNVSDPPSHPECAEFAVQVCPFLVNPERERRADLTPNDLTPGVLLQHNPGLAILWTASAVHFTRFSDRTKGTSLIRIPALAPVKLTCWCHGRQANAGEIGAALDKALTSLINLAMQHGPEAVSDLAERTLQAVTVINAHLPPEIAEAVDWSSVITNVATRTVYNARRLRLEQDINRAIVKGMMH